MATIQEYVDGECYDWEDEDVTAWTKEHGYRLDRYDEETDICTWVNGDAYALTIGAPSEVVTLDALLVAQAKLDEAHGQYEAGNVPESDFRDALAVKREALANFKAQLQSLNHIALSEENDQDPCLLRDAVLQTLNDLGL